MDLDVPPARRLPKGLSPSSMDLYHQCPKRFEIQKINGGYEPSGRDALLGTLVHRALELLMQLPPEERDLDRARACASQAWPETVEHADFLLLDMNEEQAKVFKRDAWWSIRGYFEIENPAEVSVAATEKFVNCKVNGVNLRGIIDRVDRTQSGLVISDYKSGKVPDPKYRGPKLEQLNFYAVMIEATWGTRPNKGKLIFTTHAEVIETKFTDKSCGDLVDKTTQTWEDITLDFNGRGFKTKTGPLCAWCPALSTCPNGMADVTLRMKKGRVRTDAPGYAVIKAMQAS